MRRLATFVAILIVLSAAAPLLACMTGSAMNREESACCRTMHGNCGQMAKMGCCQTEVRTDEHPQLASTPPPSNVHWAVIAWLAPVLAAIEIVPPSLLQAPEEHSPPGLLTAQITILRI
jgi:hypothetical protein